jgi:hypothetical protein
MGRRSKEQIRIDREYEENYKKHANGVQFDMFDLGKIEQESKAAHIAGATMEDAVKAAVAKYRKN